MLPRASETDMPKTLAACLATLVLIAADHAALHAQAKGFYDAPLLAASLADVARSKRTSDRPQERRDVVIIQEKLRRGLGKPDSR
jgi:hypothetical protein